MASEMSTFIVKALSSRELDVIWTPKLSKVTHQNAQLFCEELKQLIEYFHLNIFPITLYTNTAYVHVYDCYLNM